MKEPTEKQYPLTGTPEKKLTACLEAAGWHKGRKLSPEKMKTVMDFYATGGITLPSGAKSFIREFHGLAEGWYLNLSAEKYSWYPPHTLFKIFPDSEAEGLDYAARLDREEEPLWVQENLEEMCELAGEPVVWIGIIGYKYPVKIYMGSTSKGNTAQPLCVRCAVNFYVRVHKFDAALLTQGKENLCTMTEKVQADDVQRRQPRVPRCCPSCLLCRPGTILPSSARFRN